MFISIIYISRLIRQVKLFLQALGFPLLIPLDIPPGWKVYNYCMATFFIGDVAERLKLNPRTIRYYERIGILPNPGRTESGYRVYNERTVERLEFILKAKALGLKLDEIKQILMLHDRGQAPCERTQGFVINKIREIEGKMVDLASIKEKLQKILKAKRQEFAPDSICPLIEAAEERSWFSTRLECLNFSKEGG
jgi:DNA-binding transcriptional MerR regulator